MVAEGRVLSLPEQGHYSLGGIARRARTDRLLLFLPLGLGFLKFLRPQAGFLCTIR